MSLKADAAIVVAYGLILPIEILNAPALGCINVHASLLPRWRGASPIQAAVLAGDSVSGISIMQMEAGLDTGPILSQARITLEPDETAASLHDRLSDLGAKLLVNTLCHPLISSPQDEHGVTYAGRLTRETGRIDWRQPAPVIKRQILALTPWPGAFTTHDGLVLKIGAAHIVDLNTQHFPKFVPPGTCLDDELTVACGSGALKIDILQRPGKAMTVADDFLRGFPLRSGTRLGN